MPFYFAKPLLLVCSATCFQPCIWTKGDGAPHSISATGAGLPQAIKQWCLNRCSVGVTSNRRHQHLPCPWEGMGWNGPSICAKRFTNYHHLLLSQAKHFTDVWWQNYTNPGTHAWNPKVVHLLQTQFISCYDLPHPDNSCWWAREINVPLGNHSTNS